jgi:hypothetical protein
MSSGQFSFGFLRTFAIHFFNEVITTGEWVSTTFRTSGMERGRKEWKGDILFRHSRMSPRLFGALVARVILGVGWTLGNGREESG